MAAPSGAAVTAALVSLCVEPGLWGQAAATCSVGTRTGFPPQCLLYGLCWHSSLPSDILPQPGQPITTPYPVACRLVNALTAGPLVVFEY